MFLEIAYFVFITLFAHIVLTLRVYAITGKNKRIATGLYGLTIVQFGVGVYLCVYSTLHHRARFPSLRVKGVLIRLRGSPTTSDSPGRIPDLSFPDSAVRVTCLYFIFSRIRCVGVLRGRYLLWTELPLTDLAVFVIVLIRARASRLHRCDLVIPNILDAITRDAALYFSVIFSSHLLLVPMLAIVRVRARDVLNPVVLTNPTF